MSNIVPPHRLDHGQGIYLPPTGGRPVPPPTIHVGGRPTPPPTIHIPGSGVPVTRPRITPPPSGGLSK